jgi:serine-type D-Ala-D-Ala carboxypeptidase/endopeptidase (penicillin-binding protein 4)
MPRTSFRAALCLALATFLSAPAAQTQIRDAEPVGGNAVATLAHDLYRLVGAVGPGSRYGLLVVSLERGDTLFSLNPDLPLSPASNMKLYSTAAALYYLGSEYRYLTYLLADGEIEDGVLRGNVTLFGTGDPSISRRLLPATSAAFRALADSLHARGVREIAGDLIGDGSYFDANWLGDRWASYDRLAWYAPPVGALSFAENLVTIQVAPGARAGEPARIRTDPATQEFAIRNRVRTVASGATRVHVRHADEAVVVEGQIRRGHRPLSYNVPVVDPANYAAAGFREVLRERGIHVRGSVRSDHDPVRLTAPFGAARTTAVTTHIVATHTSAPLRDLASVTNHVSQNLFAEALLKTAGRVALGEGSFEAGTRVLMHFLENEVGAATGGVALYDGSGLSHANRTTARATVELLDFMARTEMAAAFEQSLPVAGRADGLRRMFGTPAAGRLRAKTGTLTGVSSLSGYVISADGERLAFSIIGNDLANRARAKQTEDAIGARLAAFQRDVPLATAPAHTAQAER